jgi:hypothetical protein
MKITRAHILGWTALAAASTALIIDTDKPEAAPAPAAAAPADDGWRIAAGNLAPGMGLYFGRHDKIYRGLIMKFVDTPHGEAAVLLKDGRLEVMLRKDIAIRDFWVRAP